MKASWSARIVFPVLAFLCCYAGKPARLQVTLSSGSVAAGAAFKAEIALMDGQNHAAPAGSECPVSVDVLDSSTKKSIQPPASAKIPDGRNAAGVTLAIGKTGFFIVRASTACMPGIQPGQIYVRVTSRTGSNVGLRPFFLLPVAQTASPQKTITVAYPDAATVWKADGQQAARIQVWVPPKQALQLFIDTNATITPQMLPFAADSAGYAEALLTSTQPGDFRAVVSPPAGYVVETHPQPAPPTHFKPDIESLRLTPDSHTGVPVNTAVNVAVYLLDKQGQVVNAEDPVTVNLQTEPGSVTWKDNPLIIPSGSASSITSFTPLTAGVYKIKGDSGDYNSGNPLAIKISAPIGFFATMLSGVLGACISCLVRKKMEWPRLVEGALAATGAWWLASIGLLPKIASSVVSDSFSAGILGALAGFAGAEVLSIVLRILFGIGAGAVAPAPAPTAGSGAPQN